jgi:hypothetical protein
MGGEGRTRRKEGSEKKLKEEELGADKYLGPGYGWHTAVKGKSRQALAVGGVTEVTRVQVPAPYEMGAVSGGGAETYIVVLPLPDLP